MARTTSSGRFCSISLPEKMTVGRRGSSPSDVSRAARDGRAASDMTRKRSLSTLYGARYCGDAPVPAVEGGVALPDRQRPRRAPDHGARYQVPGDPAQPAADGSAWESPRSR